MMARIMDSMRLSYLNCAMRRAAVAGGALSIVALAGAGCESGSAPAERIPATFPGMFLLQTIDGRALPTGIALIPSGTTMLVGFGYLSFELNPGQLTFSATGSASGTPVILGNFSPAYAAADSFSTEDGLRGRVWSDTAELLTTKATLGEHRWRYERPAATP
jgi:hypothetical protein